MRIAFITLGFAPLRLSGFAVSGERLVAGLLNEGLQVTVFAGRKGSLREVLEYPHLEVRRLRWGASDWIGYAWRVGRQLSRLDGFDVVHFWDVHFAYAYRRPFVGSIHHAFRQRLQGLGQVRGGWRPALQSLYYWLALQLAEGPAVRRARGLMAVSEFSRSAVLQAYGLPSERISVVRHGIDPVVFHPVEDVGPVRNRLGLEPDERVLLFAGFFTTRKGLDYLAQALPQIRPPVRLVLVGRWRSAALRDGFYQALGPAADRVIEAGFVRDNELPDYYSLADVYVSPSVMEGFGLPLAEALACGTPVVAAEAGAVSEVVGPGGLLVPPRDPTALAEAVNRLLADGALRSSLAQAGAAHVRLSFSVERMVAETLACYQKYLGPGAQTP